MKVPRSRRRGKSRVFRFNDFKAIGKVKLPNSPEPMNAKITKLIHDPYRTAPLMEVKFENGSKSFLPAFVGAYEGLIIQYMKTDSIKEGSVLRLGDIPTGSNVYNIELKAGDGGKLVRAGGNSARIMENTGEEVAISLSSGKILRLKQDCRAIVGKIANAGRKEKPFYKAGNKYHLIKARSRYWPMNAAVAMNAYEHKFGGKRRSTQHKSKSSSRNSPPGAKVGAIAPKRTGVR
jgi:large subunit ribosomal protein L2